MNFIHPRLFGLLQLVFNIILTDKRINNITQFKQTATQIVPAKPSRLLIRRLGLGL